MKRLIRKILREEIEKSDRHYRILDKISDHVHLPYFKSMEGLTIDDKDDQLYIMKKIYGYNIRIKGKYIYDDKGNEIYEEYDDGSWVKWEYDDNDNMLYYEDSDGYWRKYEYDDKGNKIYKEDSNGKWSKYVYDEDGELEYEEDSDGYIWDNR
jgi:YD repeat-containing protein